MAAMASGRFVVVEMASWPVHAQALDLSHTRRPGGPSFTLPIHTSSATSPWQPLPPTARWRGIARRVFKELLSPPILSTLLAIAVGCVRPVQALFFGPDAPLKLLTDSMGMLAACAVPTIMIGLGATLANGPGAAKVPLRTITGVAVCRLLILPLLGILVVVGGYKLGAFHAPDAVFLLVMLLQNTAPTAILVHTMSAVHQNHDGETSTLLFWQYLLSIVTIPPYIALFLWAVGATYHDA